jgi:hypothetical protein
MGKASEKIDKIVQLKENEEITEQVWFYNMIIYNYYISN